MRESEKLLHELAERWDRTCLLGFSRGKDSILSWLQLKKCGFKNIFPYYLKPIPEEMSFETRSLAYYEKVFKTKIPRLIDPHFAMKINNYTLTAPDRLLIWDELPQMTVCSYQDVQSHIKKVNGLPETTYTAVGVTQFDSFLRNRTIKINGPINHKKREFFPIYDWRGKEIFAEIERQHILLPPDYHLWSRSFDGIDYRFSKKLYEVYPDDFKLQQKYWHLMDLEFIRYEQV